MNNKLKIMTGAGIVYMLLAFPSFYYVYKFGNPMFGTNDFFSYYKLYSSWDIGHVEAPFNMRLLSSFFVHLFNKAGLHYDTATAFDQFGLSRQVFFNAIFFNYLCVVATCVSVFALVRKYFGNILFAFVAGTLYLLGFGTLFYEIMPITDALSVLLFAIILRYYLARSYWVIFPLLLLVLQREYIFLALGLVAFMDMIKFRMGYYVYILLVCVALFGLYFALRKTIFYTPRFDYQASPGFFAESIFTLKFPLGPYIKQTLMTMNLMLLYLGLVLYKKFRGLALDGYELLKLVLLFVQINAISFAAVFGNNTGRYFYILVPLVIFQIAKEAYPIFQSKVEHAE